MEARKDIALAAWKHIKRAIDGFNEDYDEYVHLHYPRELEIDGETYDTDDLEDEL